MDLCRLPRRPHAELELEGLNGRQALYFDLSFIRAAKEYRLHEWGEAQGSLGKMDMFGTAGLQMLGTLDLKRS